MEPEVLTTETTDKKWYESKSVIGNLVSVAALAFGFAGYTIDIGLQAEVVAAVTGVVALAGSIQGLIGRLVATKEIRG